MNSNFFLPNHLTNLVEFLCTGTFFLKKFQKPKRGEVNVEQAMIFDEVLQVVENTTSNFSERADAKYSARGNSIAFNFILRRIFGNCMYSYTYFYISLSFENHIFQKPILVLSANAHFSRQKNWKGINTKNDIGGKYLPNVIVCINLFL